MKSFTLFSSVSLVVVGVLAGCSSADSGASRDVDGTSPTGTTPDGFCAKKCIADDRDKCVAFAGRFSDAFLAAFDSCGDNPACVQPKLDAAPKTERQEQLAADYCAKCAGGIGAPDPETCASTFFGDGGPGAAVLSFSDARLDGVEEKCFAELKPGLACELTFRTCVLPLLREDLADTTLVCRQRR
jgi:hypothetical protein